MRLSGLLCLLSLVHVGVGLFVPANLLTRRLAKKHLLLFNSNTDTDTDDTSPGQSVENDEKRFVFPTFSLGNFVAGTMFGVLGIITLLFAPFFLDGEENGSL